MLYLVEIPSPVNLTSQSLIFIQKINRADHIINVSSTPLMMWMDFPFLLLFCQKGASQSLYDISIVAASDWYFRCLVFLFWYQVSPVDIPQQ